MKGSQSMTSIIAYKALVSSVYQNLDTIVLTVKGFLKYR